MIISMTENDSFSAKETLKIDVLESSVEGADRQVSFLSDDFSRTSKKIEPKVLVLFESKRKARRAGIKRPERAARTTKQRCAQRESLLR